MPKRQIEFLEQDILENGLAHCDDPKIHRILAYIVAGYSDETIVQIENISQSQLKFIRNRSDIKKAKRLAANKLLKSTTAELALLMPDAIQVFKDALKDADIPIKTRATIARDVINLNMKAIEFENSERIERLEELVERMILDGSVKAIADIDK